MNYLKKDKKTSLVAGIFLLCSLLFMPCTNMAAEEDMPEFKDEDFENCFASPLVFDYLSSFVDEELSFGDFYFKDESNSGSAIIEIFYFIDPAKASEEYEKAKKGIESTLAWVAEEEELYLVYSEIGANESGVVYGTDTSVVGHYGLLSKHYSAFLEVASSSYGTYWSDETAKDYLFTGLDCVKNYVDPQGTSTTTTTTPAGETFTVAGFVKWANGNPFVLRVLLTGEATNGEHNSYWTYSGSLDGYYEFSAVAGGNYSVFVETPYKAVPPKHEFYLTSDRRDCDFTISTLDRNCPTTLACGEHSEEVKLLRYFRDNVLSQTPEGQEFIKLYYQWSPVIVKAMEGDEQFKEEVKKMIDGVLELIE